MAIQQVFVSHSHTDNEYCRAFVAALRQGLGDEHDAVWYDEHNLGWGELRQVIEGELRKRQHFIVILSPTAADSEWVNKEIDAALTLRRRKSMQTIQFVTAMPCEVPLLLEGYKRIEQAGGLPFSPTEAARRALAVIMAADADILPPLGPAPAPANSVSAYHLTPTSLYNLGFRGYSIGGVECILPPICPVPVGVFTMGSDKSRDDQAYYDEMPQYPVEVADFAIGQHPVTVAEYACAVRANVVREPRKQDEDNADWQTQQTHPDHPVVGASWDDAFAYMRWLAKTTRQGWQLPTEAEWEKAARGTDGRIYPWGDAFDKARCNTHESGIRTTTPVGRYPNGISPYHVYDMAGNVWEWTSSLYMPYPYRKSDGRENVNSIYGRVPRGASWGDYPFNARAANRASFSRPADLGNYGFRLVLALAAAGSG